MNIRPLHDRVVVKRGAAERKKYAGTTVEIMDEELLVIREDDILGVLEAA